MPFNQCFPEALSELIASIVGWNWSGNAWVSLVQGRTRGQRDRDRTDYNTVPPLEVAVRACGLDWAH
jgi:hypothetical protein